MRKILLVLFICVLYIACAAAQSNAAQPPGDDEADAQRDDVTLSELAAGADFIGIVQVNDREYETVREIPSEGFAILRVLVTYRHPGEVRETPGSVQVYEKGFERDTCYYPERRNEGRRYLVFLQERTGKTPDGKPKEGYEGSRPGCMIPVFVTADNQYALRYPVPGVEITDRDLVRDLVFADPDAFVEPGVDLSYTRADYMVEQGWLKKADNDRYVYTRGVYLEEARGLMDLGADRRENGEGGD